MVLCPGLLYGIVDIFSIVVLFNFFKLANSGLVLNDFITHFEPLFYDHRYLQDQHRRARRSPMDHFITIHFTAHNRLFRLRLKRDTSVFAPNSEFESSENTVHYDTARVLTGYLEDDENSSVEGVITNSGLLDGVVRARDEEYYIEPAEKYLPPPHHFHSVIYRLSDVRFPKANFTCLSHHIHHTVQQRSLVDPPFADHTRSNHFHSLDGKSLQKRKSRSRSLEGSLRTKTGEKMQYRALTKAKDARRSHHNFHQLGHKISMDSEKFLTRLSNDLHSVHIKQQRHLKTINFTTQLDLLSMFSHTANKSDKRFRSQWTSSKNYQANGWYISGTSSSRAESEKGIKHIIYGKSPSVVYANSTANPGREWKKNNGVPQALRGRQPFDTTERMDAEDIVPYWRELDALHYTEDGRTGSSEPYGVRSIQRTQWTEERGQRHVAVDRRKSTCLLYLQADHLFYQRMGSEEACIEAMTRHVQRVNSIYRTTDFDQDGRPDNISFLIKRIKVHTKPDEPEYRFVGNYGVEKFLELFSEDDYDAFCLAYMFTYRDFEGGTLGLAWTGDLKNAGGVCEKNGHYRGSLKSLNTGIITLLNYGKHVPPVVSHVTLAHEIGHNFGSPHDPEDDQHCTPGGEHGNYIMFARATSGDKKNNNKFSPCSLRSINAVLNTKARSVKGCFTEPLDAVCGNEVVEGAEECDCGWEEDCHEPCCFPMRVSPPQDQPPCRLRPAAFCSPSQGPCCSHDCRLKYDVMCREDNGCRTASYCDGKGPQCPPSTKKPNKTICSEEFVCYKGECTGSICMAYGLESCQCVRSFHDPLIRSCELCCKLPGDELSCKSSFEWNLPPYDVPDLYAKPGAPCDNYNGYCDVYQTCREIDPSGPLATLRKLLLSPEGAAVLRRWLAERWWGLLLLFLAVAFTVAISVRLLSRRNAKSFLSTILPGQSDFRFCHSRSSSHSHPSHLVASASGTTNNLVKSSIASRPRISSAPENGWV